MFSFLKKKKSMISKIEEYLSSVDNCFDKYEKCMHSFLNKKNDPEQDDLVQDVHDAESIADDIRRSIELELYQKNLIPSSRGDILGVLEALDKIPGALEGVCFQIHLRKIVIPDDYKNEIKELVKINIEAYKELRKSVVGYFYDNNKNIVNEVKNVDAKESDSDKLERKMIKSIYGSSMDKSDKVLLADVVTNIGKISNRSLSVADRINLAILKRNI